MLRGQLELTPDLRKSFFSNGDDSSKTRKNEKIGHQQWIILR